MTRLVVAALVGVMTWSLCEYLLHRFLGHDRRTMPNPFSVEHTRHHSLGDYFAPSWKKAIVAVAALALIGPLASAVVGLPLGAIFGSSFVSMYVTYEVIHRRAHTHPGFGPYARYLRRHHFHHHFENPRANHGVTSPIWDFVFGTFEAPTKIRVPRKLKMQWLCHPDSEEVRSGFASVYELS
jgi:sterol desaturase/sphingolipid hydroxylase (fatty acid hydroxylase superfamily)